MKKNLILTAITAVTLSFVFYACKKDKGEAVSPTKENLTGTYKLISLKAKIAGTTQEVDGMATFIEPCQKDDLYKLNADLSFQYVDAGVICDEPGDYESEWSVSNNVVSFDVWNMTVVKFDGKTLVGTETISQGGQSATLTGTFQKQ